MTNARSLAVKRRVATHWHRTGKLVYPTYRWTHAEAWLQESLSEWITAQNRRASQTPLWTGFFARVREAQAALADPFAELDRISLLLQQLAQDEQLLRAEAVAVPLTGWSNGRHRDLNIEHSQLEDLRKRMDELHDFLAGIKE